MLGLNSSTAFVSFECGGVGCTDGGCLNTDFVAAGAADTDVAATGFGGGDERSAGFCCGVIESESAVSDNGTDNV